MSESDMLARVHDAIEKALDNAFEKAGRLGGHLDTMPVARAVIEAMREPTEEMIEAADELSPIARGTETHAMSGGKVPEDCWRAMINAALE